MEMRIRDLLAWYFVSPCSEPLGCRLMPQFALCDSYANCANCFLSGRTRIFEWEVQGSNKVARGGKRYSYTGNKVCKMEQASDDDLCFILNVPSTQRV